MLNRQARKPEVALPLGGLLFSEVYKGRGLLGNKSRSFPLWCIFNRLALSSLCWSLLLLHGRSFFHLSRWSFCLQKAQWQNLHPVVQHAVLQFAPQSKALLLVTILYSKTIRCDRSPRRESFEPLEQRNNVPRNVFQGPSDSLVSRMIVCSIQSICRDTDIQCARDPLAFRIAWVRGVSVAGFNLAVDPGSIQPIPGAS